MLQTTRIRFDKSPEVLGISCMPQNMLQRPLLTAKLPTNPGRFGKVKLGLSWSLIDLKMHFMFYFYLFAGSARRVRGYRFDVRHTESDRLTGRALSLSESAREKTADLELKLWNFRGKKQLQLQKVPLCTAPRSHASFAKFPLHNTHNEPPPRPPNLFPICGNRFYCAHKTANRFEIRLFFDAARWATDSLI